MDSASVAALVGAGGACCSFCGAEGAEDVGMLPGSGLVGGREVKPSWEALKSYDGRKGRDEVVNGSEFKVVMRCGKGG